MLGKQRLEDTGACVTQTALETQLSRLRLLGKWRLQLAHGGSALVSKKGKLVVQMLKHQNLADSVRHDSAAGGQGFPVATLRPTLGDLRWLSAFFAWIHVPWARAVREVWPQPSGTKVHVQFIVYGKGC